MLDRGMPREPAKGACGVGAPGGRGSAVVSAASGEASERVAGRSHGPRVLDEGGGEGAECGGAFGCCGVLGVRHWVGSPIGAGSTALQHAGLVQRVTGGIPGAGNGLVSGTLVALGSGAAKSCDDGLPRDANEERRNEHAPGEVEVGRDDGEKLSVGLKHRAAAGQDSRGAALGNGHGRRSNRGGGGLGRPGVDPEGVVQVVTGEVVVRVHRESLQERGKTCKKKTTPNQRTLFMRSER